MYDAGEELTLQRARGRAAVAWRRADGQIRLDRLFQSGSAKILLPKTHAPVPEAVWVNTAGGITGGDRFRLEVSLGPGAAGVVTSQAAERVYRARGGAGRSDIDLTLSAGARLDWLPQETILFEGGRLERRLGADLEDGAALMLLETVVLGRRAMGETLEDAGLLDHWRIRRNGRLVFAEALRLIPPLSALGGPAALGDTRAFATFAMIAPDAEDRLDRARAALPPGAAASAWNGALVCRFLAADATPLRAGLIRFLTAFRDGALPRVWQS